MLQVLGITEVSQLQGSPPVTREVRTPALGEKSKLCWELKVK